MEVFPTPRNRSAPPRPTTRQLLATIALVVASTACGNSGSGDTAPVMSSTTGATTTTAPVTTSTAPAASTTEIQFESGDFALTGDLVLPGGEGPHPAMIVVSGSGHQTRYGTPTYTDVVRIFGDAGFAVFSWDKPGSGASTGTFDEEQTLRQRAAILVDGIRTLRDRPDVDPDQIGLWGLSQAGWVMPLALELTDDIAFMISVSGGGEDSIEQLAYQISEQLVCEGVPREEAELAEEWGPQAAKGTTYELYVEAMEILLEIPGMTRFVEMADENEWQPWPPEIDAYFDPMSVIENTTIPVLAIFGDIDKNIDPIQGAEAYSRALAAAGNPDYHVEIIPGVGHTMHEQQTGCIGEPPGPISERYLELLEEWASKLASGL